MKSLTLPCPYCAHPVPLTVRDVVSKYRGFTLCEYKCPHCDSLAEIVVSQRRKRKGKRFKQAEAIAELKRQANVKRAIELNDRFALVLLAQPGCECAQHANNRHRDGSYYYAEQRADGLVAGGNAGTIPLPPRHRNSCPLSGEDIETTARANARKELDDATST